MKILVTGDRYWKDVDTIAKVLEQYPSDTTLIEGYADGADTIAYLVGQQLGFTCIRCPAHWSHNTPRWVEIYGECDVDCHQVSGNAAGMIRNNWMYDTYKPDRILAFHNDIQASKGTKAMIQYAMKKGSDVRLYTSHGSELINKQIWNEQRYYPKI